ncbi:MAG: ATP-binding cassette domain-containing protein, partial [Deltaproteobacteria bacterium]|nr:ATP-binding cassette domain-containing protein [Deltaproteobacteria bacterium]
MNSPKAAAPPMLDLHGVRKVFHPGTPYKVVALDGISLEVEKGSFVIIIGTNGSGKSALLNAIAGSVPFESGRISLMGRDITGWPEHLRSKYIGRVFQNPLMGTITELTVAENLVLSSSRSTLRSLRTAVTRRSMNDIKDRVASLKLGLETRLNE